MRYRTLVSALLVVVLLTLLVGCTASSPESTTSSQSTTAAGTTSSSSTSTAAGPEYKLNFYSNPSEGGTVSPKSGQFAANSDVYISATPAANFRFDHWSGAVSGTSNTLTVKMDGPKDITAHFVPQYKLTTGVDPTNSGAVSPASGAYDWDSVIAITPQPADGYRFDHWSSDAQGTDNPLQMKMQANKKVVANFVPQNNLTVTISPAEAGVVQPGSGNYDVGAQLNLEAKPKMGFVFDRWSGDIQDTANPASIKMDKDRVVTAHFNQFYMDSNQLIGFLVQKVERLPKYPDDLDANRQPQSGKELLSVSLKCQYLTETTFRPVVGKAQGAKLGNQRMNLFQNSGSEPGSTLLTSGGDQYPLTAQAWYGLTFIDPSNVVTSCYFIADCTGQLLFEVPAGAQVTTLKLLIKRKVNLTTEEVTIEIPIKE